jgi:aspartate kinase
MSGATNDLIKKTRELSDNFDPAEYDVLLSSGEQVACALIAGRLKHLGYNARSWMSWQLPIITDGPYSASRISKINKNKILKFIKSGGIPIITGFQGINLDNRITTLGRGGTDASAIMLAKFFNASACDIYTDVDGVYTTDPRNHLKAKKINKISYDEMLEMASLGAKVMQPTSVQDAKLNNISFSVKSSFVKKKGTLITGNKKAFSNQIITGITATKNDAKITMIGVKDKPGVAASIFKPLSLNHINVDMVVQNISLNSKETDLTFTIKSEELKKTEKIIKKNKKISFREFMHDSNVSKVSIIGVGMITTPGITYRMFQALASKKINIMVISTSEIKISVLIANKHVKKAIVVLHKEFKLD